MKLGMIGCGQMGGGMTKRLRLGGHVVVGFDRDPAVSDVASLHELLEALESPRTLWLMLPAGDVTGSTIVELADLLDAGDLIIDGSNSYFRDSIRRGASLAEHGIRFIDAGVSGGIRGATDGFCLMVGGDPSAVTMIEPAMVSLASPAGFAHVGPSGSGHFTKMIHNAIEYGLLQAYAEGFELMRASREFPTLDVAAVAELWRHGSVVRSWLLDLAAQALSADPALGSVAGYVEDSGEGRWAILEAIATDTPVPVTALSLFARFGSRQEDSFAMKMIAALRQEFGGHAVRTR